MYPPDHLPQNQNGLTHINTSQPLPQSHLAQQQPLDQGDLSHFYRMSLSQHENAAQWGQDPSIGMDYMPMQTDLDPSLGLGMPMGSGVNNGIGMGMGGSQTGYGYEYEIAGMRQGQQMGYTPSTPGSHAHAQQLAHGSQSGYLQSPISADAISPAALESAWRGWYEQFSTT
jgi:hypothetical protein